ncbi:MAG: hypothetical protein IT324_05145 [Anaerolineae bacterium]|nr:hypothetical protein [Anaerolineae bacterium]
MQVKIIMNWDIKPGRDQEYFEFVVREFAPGITRLGLQPTEAWFTVYGECPQIMMGGITTDFDTMKNMLDSKEWQDLQDKLMQYVNNYEQKIVRFSPGFQL